MSTATAPAAEQHHDAHSGHGPSDRVFVRTAIFLAIITGIEVAWTYLPWAEGQGWRLFEIAGLMLMMAIKFVMVAGTFMHLKFDSKLLSCLFYGGLLLAVAVYLAVLATFSFWSSGEPPYVG
jgi:cytochrome c oxidase subunit 4